VRQVRLVSSIISASVGTLCCSLVAALLPIRLLSLVLAGYTALNTLLLLPLPRTPQFLVRKDAETDARASLQFYRGKSYSGLEMELAEMQSCSNRVEDSQAAGSQTGGSQTAGSKTAGIQTATAALWKYGEARFYKES